MDRLTYTAPNGKTALVKLPVPDNVQEAFQRLADYEEAEEKGLLLRLPCKTGDTLYMLESVYSGKKLVGEHITQVKVDNFQIGDAGTPMITVCDDCNNWTLLGPEHFGKSIFYTEDEAKAAFTAGTSRPLEVPLINKYPAAAERMQQAGWDACGSPKW